MSQVHHEYIRLVSDLFVWMMMMMALWNWRIDDTNLTCLKRLIDQVDWENRYQEKYGLNEVVWGDQKEEEEEEEESSTDKQEEKEKEKEEEDDDDDDEDTLTIRSDNTRIPDEDEAGSWADGLTQEDEEDEKEKEKEKEKEEPPPPPPPPPKDHWFIIDSNVKSRQHLQELIDGLQVDEQEDDKSDDPLNQPHPPHTSPDYHTAQMIDAARNRLIKWLYHPLITETTKPLYTLHRGVGKPVFFNSALDEKWLLDSTECYLMAKNDTVLCKLTRSNNEWEIPAEVELQRLVDLLVSFASNSTDGQTRPSEWNLSLLFRPKGSVERNIVHWYETKGLKDAAYCTVDLDPGFLFYWVIWQFLSAVQVGVIDMRSAQATLEGIDDEKEKWTNALQKNHFRIDMTFPALDAIRILLWCIAKSRSLTNIDKFVKSDDLRILDEDAKILGMNWTNPDPLKGYPREDAMQLESMGVIVKQLPNTDHSDGTHARPKHPHHRRPRPRLHAYYGGKCRHH